MKCLFIIPARGGSKGIPGKNLAQLGGKPLIQWTVEAAQKTNVPQAIYVSSDDTDILNTAQALGVNIRKRPTELAADASPTGPVIDDLLSSLSPTINEFDYLVLLQPTSPLRSNEHIQAALQTLTNSDAEALISVTEPDKHPLKAFLTDEQGYMKTLANKDAPFMPRQALPQAFYPNGALYIVRMDAYRQKPKLLQDRTLPFVMDATSSVDIDSQEDLAKAEQLLRNKR